MSTNTQVYVCCTCLFHYYMCCYCCDVVIRYPIVVTTDAVYCVYTICIVEHIAQHLDLTLCLHCTTSLLYATKHAPETNHKIMHAKTYMWVHTHTHTRSKAHPPCPHHHHHDHYNNIYNKHTRGMLGLAACCTSHKTSFDRCHCP